MKTQKVFATCLTVVSVLLGGGIVSVPLSTADAQVIVTAECSKCKKPVPITSRAGQTCPHCGIYWSGEQSKGGENDADSAPLTPLEMLALWQAMLLQQRIAKMQELREEIAAKRELKRQWAREETERVRAHDDPQQRAKQHLDAALACEHNGDVMAAAAFYRLVIRSQPETPAARRAAVCLARLGVR
ncbi:MAG: hypothetical protein NTY19_05090 [Planctomycetota bacterium]|nr:hypothetical protein [Planctomycetota bacterium]